EMYVEYGFYKEKLISFTKKGKSGAEEIQEMMKNLRSNPPQYLAGSQVVKLFDYASQQETHLVRKEQTEIKLPKENVLQFLTEDESLISARPSGTEPKIKFYVSVNEPLGSIGDFDLVNERLDKKVEMLLKDMNVL
ncbi:MAG TPA: phospho-sugar mutase, partial [Cytophagaceae bacterium]